MENRNDRLRLNRSAWKLLLYSVAFIAGSLSGTYYVIVVKLAVERLVYAFDNDVPLDEFLGDFVWSAITGGVIGAAVMLILYVLPVLLFRLNDD